MSRETVEISSIEDGVTLEAWFYRPSAPAVPPYPVVIGGHGFTLVKEAGLAVFGERWAKEAGYAALLFDFRGFGGSGGELRNDVHIKKQLQDYQSVIEWARGRPELFRTDNIVLSGYSLSGLLVADLVVHDPGLAGAIAQCPALDAFEVLMALPKNPWVIFWAMIDVIRKKFGLSPIYVAAAGKPGDLAFFTTPSSHPGFTAVFAQGNISFSQATNVVAPRTAFRSMKFRPGLELKKAKCPMLVIAAKEDDILNISMTERIVKKSEGKVELCIVPGGHFDILCPGNPGFNINIKAQIEFLHRLL